MASNLWSSNRIILAALNLIFILWSVTTGKLEVKCLRHRAMNQAADKRTVVETTHFFVLSAWSYGCVWNCWETHKSISEPPWQSWQRSISIVLRHFSGHLILPWSNLSDLSAEDCQDPSRFCISLPLGRALLGGSSGWQHMATICAQLSKIKPCLTCYMGLFVILRYRKVGWFIMMVSNMNMHVFRVYCNFIQQ